MTYFILAPNRNDLYWKEKRQGYTTDLADAGIYSQNEAIGIERLGRGDKSIMLLSKLEEIRKLKSKAIKDQERLQVMLEMLGLDE